mgnify:CR=1 FL=1
MADERKAWRAYHLSDCTIFLQPKDEIPRTDCGDFIAEVYGDYQTALNKAEDIVDEAIDALEDRYCD